KRRPKSRPTSPAAQGAEQKSGVAEVVWTRRAGEDRDYWRTHDGRLAERVERIVADIVEHPVTGVGKPEPLKRDWSGYWSRRITNEHRLVYRVEAGVLYILQARYHY
ncbi:MAG TPA: Txe/YoeB family addiction module toxin, partial [Burkholderiales bacterium]|nr:Txe/YoeB family addiction module toxin [Burkholderiales bacterium]